MKALLLCALVLCCGLKAAQCCSCVQGALSRSRLTAIRDDFCFSSMVYSARVVGAVCNCVMGTTNLRCVNYTQGDSALTAQVTTMGVCEGATIGNTFLLDMCANLSSALSVNTAITEVPGLPTVNLTAEAEFGRCPNVCPFNSVDNDDDYLTKANPCQYTLEVLEVFKPTNTTFSSPLVVTGPDVLTSCGNPSRRTSIGETYLVGVGGPCSPFSEWSTLDTYSDNELSFLRALSGDVGLVCGAVGTVPSIVTLVLSVLLLLVVAV